jgi:prophage regulatory protein
MQTVTRIDTVSTALARSRAAIYRDVKHKLLPPPFSLGNRSVGWLASEIQLIQAARCAGKSEAKIKQLVEQLIESRQRLFSDLAEGGTHD